MSTDAVPARFVLRLALSLTIVGGQLAVALTHAREVPLQVGAVVLLLLQVGWMARASRRHGNDGPQRALVAAGLALAAGLLADVLLHETGHDLPAHLAFVAGSTLASVFAFRALLRWDRLGSGTHDSGNWVNALGSVAVLISAGVLVTEAVGLPAAEWPTWQLLTWLGQLAIGAVLIGACLTVGLLAGMRRDRRLYAVLVAYLAHVVAQGVVSAWGYDATERASALGQVVVCTAAVAAVHRPLPSRWRSQGRPPVTSSWSLLLLGICSVVLVATAYADLDHTGTSAAIGALATVVAITRVSSIVRELESLAQVRREARTDDLTGLANRRGLVDALEALLQTRRRSGDLALLTVDLSGFKHVNDRYGPTTGDHVLRAVADRLQSCLSARQLLARVAGDQFAVLLPGADERAARALAVRLTQAVAHPFEVPGAVVRLGVHVGVAPVLAGRGTVPTTDELVRRANMAMYSARRTGMEVAVFDPAEDERERVLHERVEELRRLLSADPDESCGDVVVHVQPQVDVTTGRLVGAEALVRWQHPQHGLLYPDAFIDLVERHGLMAPLTRVVLRLATHEAARWEQAGRPCRMSVNLSSSSFADGDVVCLVEQALTSSGLRPELLALEITESVLLENLEAVPEVLERLAARGVGLSIDDFGTGYSSLAYLADLPVDELKIDRAFVQRLVRDERTRAVVAGTIDLAHRLRLRVVAEGVEDVATLEVLRHLGCDVSQGYLHGRPAPADDLCERLDDQEPVDQPT